MSRSRRSASQDDEQLAEKPTRLPTHNYEEIPWDAEEDEVTARVFEELAAQRRRDEARAARKRARLTPDA